MPNPQIALFDVAGTLTRGNTWTNIVKYPAIDSARKRNLLIWGYPAWLLSKAGLYNEVSFRDKWVRGMAGLLAGWQRVQVQEMFAWLVAEHAVPTLYQDVVAEIQRHKANGVHVILVSNMFTEAVQLLADKVGADKGLGTHLVFENDVATGAIDGDSCSGPSKMNVVREYLQSHGLSVDLKHSAAAYSDSWSDRYMLEDSAHPVAVYPDKKLRKYAQAQGWQMIGTTANGHLDV